MATVSYLLHIDGFIGENQDAQHKGAPIAHIALGFGQRLRTRLRSESQHSRA